MAARQRERFAVCVLGFLLCGNISPGGPLMSMQSSPPDGTRQDGDVDGPGATLRVAVFNTAHVPVDVLSEALNEAARVYEAAGVRLVWINGLADAGAARESIPSSGEPSVRVIIVGDAAERQFIADGGLARAVLGFAPARRNCFCGSNAYIFSDRIASIGYRRGNPTSLLGRVVAHELGHLLLSSDSHSRTGIMRATLDTELSFEPRFMRGQAAALKRGLRRLQPGANVQAAQNMERPEASLP